MARNTMMEPVWFTPAPIRGRFHLGLWVSSPKTPEPDPAIGRAAEQNAEIGREALAFSKQQYEENKPIVAKYQELADKYVTSQSALADKQAAIADDQWNNYKTLFQPVEQQMVSDAMGYDSQANQAKQAGMAAADVGNAYAIARKNMTQQLADQGVDVNSGKYAGSLRQLGINQAAQSAGAQSAARQNTVDKAISLRAGAANLGRGLANTSSNAYGAAVATQNSALGNQASTINAANAGAAPMYTGYGTAISGNNAAGNLYLGQYNGQLSSYNAQQQANAGMMGGLGTAAGMIGGAIFSSKKLKENKQPVDHEADLKNLDAMPVEQWDYKHGVADEGTHVGPYAEDMQQATGVGDGKTINLADELGFTMSAVKGLSRKVARLEKAIHSKGIERKGARA